VIGAPSTMVVHVAKAGKDMPGLLRYLYGPGKSDEHTNQRMITSSTGLAEAYPGALTSSEASELGRVVDLSWRDQMAEASALAGVGRGGVSRATLRTGGGPGTVEDSDKQHVYHLIASLPPGSQWTDQQWAVIAEDLVTGMGFTEGPEDDRGCRWMAVGHGRSAGGNEHIHIAVNLVRQDGHRASVHNDFVRVRQVRESIEQTRDFVLPLHDKGRAPVRSLPGYSQAEHARARERARDGGSALPDRVLLHQVLRAAAGSSRTEAEWIETVLAAGDGIEMEAARWAPGGREEATGYKIRLGDGPWLSASAIAPDLTLGKLRPQWADAETDDSRARARALWREEADLPAVHTPARPSQDLDAAEAALAEWAADLRAADPDDRALWRQASQDAAAVTSSMSRSPGPAGEALAGAAQTLSRQSLAVAGEQAPAPRPHFGPRPAQLAVRHMQIALRAGGTDSHPGWVAVLQQLRQVLSAIEAARRARQELVAATQLAGARRVVSDAEQHARAQYRTNDLDGLREARRARETSMVPGRAAAATGTLSTRPEPRRATAAEPRRHRGR